MRGGALLLPILLLGCAHRPSAPEADLADFQRIEAGTFLMGSPLSEVHRKADEGPQTSVTISRPFLMARHPVTVGEFRRFTEATGYQTRAERDGWSHEYTPDGIVETAGRSWRNPGFPQRDDHPVVCIHWEDIQAYRPWRSDELGRVVRLPTEAEWEYACRAGTTSAYWWGDDVAGGEGCANLAKGDVPWDDGFPYTSPVGAFRPNPWGLHDMHGNVWEWCSDLYGGPHPGGSVTDPKGATEGDHYLRRGGSWYPGTGTARSANRGRSRADFRVNNRGFRVVIEIPQQSE